MNFVEKVRLAASEFDGRDENQEVPADLGARVEKFGFPGTVIRYPLTFLPLYYSLVSKMSRTVQQVIQEEFLLARAKILELAAIFDRIDRAAKENTPHATDDLEKSKHQLQLLARGVAILQESEPQRAGRVQALMSRAYDPNWRQQWTI